MKRILKRGFCFSLLAVCAVAGVTTSQANVTGFNFENSNLATSVGPGSMHFLNDGANATQNGTIFGTTTELGLPAINGQVANVMKFPSVSGPNNGYHINHGFADNDGPTVGYLDTYTFGIDMLIATAPASGYIGVFNTTEANGNDAEIWLHWDATPGFWRHGAGGNYGNNSLSLNTWSRILFRVENSATLDIFVNGVQVANNVAWDSGDSLYTTTAPGAFGGGDFSILGDGTGYHGSGYVSSVAVWDVALSDSEITALGGAKAQGLVAVPEPASMSLLLLSGVALFLRRRPVAHLS